MRLAACGVKILHKVILTYDIHCHARLPASQNEPFDGIHKKIRRARQQSKPTPVLNSVSSQELQITVMYLVIEVFGCSLQLLTTPGGISLVIGRRRNKICLIWLSSRKMPGIGLVFITMYSSSIKCTALPALVQLSDASRFMNGNGSGAAVPWLRVRFPLGIS